MTRPWIFRGLAAVIGLFLLIAGIWLLSGRGALASVTAIVVGLYLLHFAVTGRSRLTRPKQ